MRLIVLLLAVVSLPALEINGPDFRRDDHQKHAVAGAIVGAGALGALLAIKPEATKLERFLVPTIAASLVGALKEVADSRDPDSHTAEAGDFAATALGGCAIGIVVQVSF